MASVKDPLTVRERATITILMFIAKMLNPTGFTFEIKQLQDELDKITKQGTGDTQGE